MTKRIKISAFNKGLQQTPASRSGGWQGASDMANLVIDENGYLEVSGAYTESDIEIEGRGDRLSIFHYPGVPRTALTPVTKYYRTEYSAINIGRRGFFEDRSGNPKWRDLVSNSEYDWEMDAPQSAPTTGKTKDRSIIGAGEVYDKISDILVIPNPFHNKGLIIFELTQPINLRIIIGNRNGEKVAYLDENGTIATADEGASEGFRAYTTGTKEVPWNGTDSDGDRVNRGVYLISIETGDKDNPVEIASSSAGLLGFTEQGEELPAREVKDEFVDEGELELGAGLRRATYLVCYTYANPELGMETPPSPISKQKVISFEVKSDNTPQSFGRAPYAIEMSNYLSNLPAWADRVKFYVKRGYIGDEIRYVKETPYISDFIYVGGPGREELQDNIAPTWRFANERVDPSRQYLPFIDENTPPINDFSHLTAYAGRMYAWDRRTGTVRFSLIDGYGVSRYDIFPYEGSPLPHAIRFEGSWQGNATALHIIPGTGGLYVFFEDSIATIRGKGLISGLYSADISPHTDLDASGGLRGVGSSSPRGITDNGSTTYFIGSDKKVYALSGSRVLSTENISLDIQESLNALTAEQLKNAVLTYYEKNLYLLAADFCLKYDIQRKYWTKYLWDLQDAVWAPGGDQTDSLFFGLTSGGLYHLGSGDIDQLEWLWQSNEIIVPDRTRLLGIFCKHASSTTQIQIRIDVDGNEGVWRWFTPIPSNKFRFSVFERVHGNIKVAIRGVGNPPKLHMLEAIIS